MLHRTNANKLELKNASLGMFTTAKLKSCQASCFTDNTQQVSSENDGQFILMMLCCVSQAGEPTVSQTLFFRV